MIRLKKLLILFLSASFLFSCSWEDINDRDTGRSANLKLTGSSGPDLLNDMKFTSMNIEVVYAEGYRPTDGAITIFRNFLESRVYKPDGIQINLRSVEPSGRSPFNQEDITAVERETRTLYNVGDEIAVWIYFADGKKEEESDTLVTLGSAFRNTSIIIYEKTINDFASKNGAPPKAIIEASTLNHEFGHLFGLVNLGIEPVTDHEEFVIVDGDEKKGGHCNVENCLMSRKLAFGSGTIDVIDGFGVPELDDACIQDLQSVGGK